MATYRVGVAGLVHDHVWGELKKWQELPNVQLAAAGDVNAELRGKIQSQFGVPRVYDSWQEMLENDLSLELEGLPVLQRAIALCLEQADTGSRELLEHLLVSAEEHVAWLEAQVSLIKTVGYENYCAQHMQPG